MEAKFIPIEEIRSTLDRLRQDPKTQRNFPWELWTSIIQLTKIHPVEEVCRQLQINPKNGSLKPVSGMIFLHNHQDIRMLWKIKTSPLPLTQRVSCQILH